MRKSILLLLLILNLASRAQMSPADSMKLALLEADTDSVRFELLSSLGDHYADIRTDSSLFFFKHAHSIAMQNGRNLSAAYALTGMSAALRKYNAYGQSLEALNEGFSLANAKNNKKAWPVKGRASDPDLILVGLHLEMAKLLGNTNNAEQQDFHLRQGLDLANKARDLEGQSLLYSTMADVKRNNGQIDSSLLYTRLAIARADASGDPGNIPHFYNNIARTYFEKGRPDSAIAYLHWGSALAMDQYNLPALLESHRTLTEIYLERKRKDSSLYYAILSLEDVEMADKENNLGAVYENLFKAYALNGRQDSAYKYQGLALTTKDSMYNEKIKVLSDFQNLSFTEKLRIQELESEKELNQGRIRTYALLAGTGLILLLAFIFYRNSRIKQRAHDKLQKTYSDLKETQKQLIQSEKMASLGELTAGIAHEIQNPLNFVKNFSEVNMELTEELAEYIDKGDVDEVKAIAADIRANQQKIKYHGERADSIVKSMLQHSRASTGQKETTDINQLCDEYCRLAFHGMRAKDKSFNAEIKTQLSNIMVPVSVIPQDIGRVVLNLINNALYAVDKKAKRQLPNYKPEVLLTTSKTGNNIEIRIKDNGDGIPENIRDKIFQPFFTTKPAGEGTGLGLSLSYDIITKGHGGDMKLESREGIGTTFTITLPIQGK